MKTAIIIGCDGQDGRIAFDQLTEQGSRVLGLGVGKVRSSGVSWDVPVDITQSQDVEDVLKAVRPDEVYYLAAYHHSSQDQVPAEVDLYNKSHDINGRGLLHFLEGIRAQGLKTKLFYASSSLIFGTPAGEVQNEETPFAPDTVYGISKLNGLLLCRYYRVKYGIFSSVGILYNHESPYRLNKFISKKITTAAVNILNKQQDILIVGDLNAEVDWGWAPDYVDAMTRILKLDTPDDFIIASGEKHSVREFVAVTFGMLGLSWENFVKEDQGLMTRKRKVMVGDASKLKRLTSWHPRVDFKGMVKLLLQAQGVDL